MDLPENLDDLDGSHNGKDYIAYTFYVRNNGNADFDYRYELNVKEVTRNLDSAIRVGMYYNGGNPVSYTHLNQTVQLLVFNPVRIIRAFTGI